MLVGSMDQRNILRVLLLILAIGLYVTAIGYQPIPDEQYEVLLKLLKNDFNVPVKDRTKIQKSTVVKFWRNKYSLGKDGQIMLNGKPVLRESQVSKVVKHVIRETKGSGTRKLYKRIAREITGLSENRVKTETEKSFQTEGPCVQFMLNRYMTDTRLI